MGVPQDAVDCGVTGAGTREQATHRKPGERRRYRTPNGLALCHGG